LHNSRGANPFRRDEPVAIRFQANASGVEAGNLAFTMSDESAAPVRAPLGA
jgi:hypothetical protein